jgi:methylated-DNA-[protein]-cysteine S-methyltransferase
MKSSFIKTPIGNFLAHFKDRFLIRLELVNSIEKLFLDKNLQETFNQLIKGAISVNEFPLNINKLEGTKFQKKVWKSLTKIKYGDTSSYQEIAVSINNPNAFRAVGSACRLNPIPLIIPCHRVLRSDRNIGKYAFGIKNKHKLLKLESYESRNRNKK